MASERIGDMTKDELKSWVIELVEERMIYWPGEKPVSRSPKEVFESIQKNRLKRKPGEPSTLEMLREDRDR